MAGTRSLKEELQHLTVYGYVREKYRDCPDDIKQLCYEFYLKVFDQWDIEKCNEGLNIDAETGIVEGKYDAASMPSNGWYNAFGSLIVKKGDIETWKIKPLLARKMIVTVGIVESCKASKVMNYSFSAASTKAGIAYGGAGSGWVYDGLNGKTGKIINNPWNYRHEISLTLDMSVGDRKYGRLSMQKGNEKEMTIYDEVDMDREYRLGLDMYLSSRNNHQKLQLVSD